MFRISKFLKFNSYRHLCTTPNKLGVPYTETLQDHGKEKSRELPERADVVVIGGGVAGCSALYHLAKMGITNTVLLESHSLTAGTTWHTAGLVWHLRPSDVEIQLLTYSWDLMKGLEAETGVNTGYIENGGLFVASTKNRLDEYQRLATLGKVFGVESEVLGPAETQRLYPLMNVEDVYGCLHSASDGTIDPAGYCTSLVRGATRLGARCAEGVSVTGIETRPGATELCRPRVGTVVTAGGHRINTDCVVLAAGSWSRSLARLAGVKVPLCTLKHAYVVSERIEGIQNMPNVRDHDASFYLRLQGDALSIGGYEPHPIFWTPHSNDGFSLFDLDWDVFSPNIEGAINRVPVIARTGIKSTVCGPESFTPDHKPLMGESVEVGGLFLNCGYNSAGMMLSGGCGREIARWIKTGRPGLDMFGYDVRRFSEHLTDSDKWIDERSHEAYVKNYSIVYKSDEPLASRNMIQDSLYEELRLQGCVYQERQGFERPGWFSSQISELLPYDFYGSYDRQKHVNYPYRDLLKYDYTFDFPKNHDTIAAECMAARNEAALFNMSYFGKAYLTGPDAHQAAEWLFTARRKPPGGVIYTCMCNQYGGTETDLTFAEIESASQPHGPHNPQFTEPTYYLAVGGAVYQYVLSYIRDVLETEGLRCSLVDHSRDMVLLSIQGPRSRDILQTVIDVDLADSAFPFSTQKLVHVAGHSCRALRLSFVGELGWELHIPSGESAVAVYRALVEAGRLHGLKNAGYRAIDSLSIEKGYRHWHADLRSDDTPLEAGLGFTCKMRPEDPQFLGRLALQAQKKSGLTKRLALFSLEKPVQLHGLEAILRDGEYVGFLRRAEYAHFLGRSIGYGYVTANGGPVSLDYLVGGSYELEQMGRRYEAQYHTKTLFDPSNKRVKGIYE